MSVISSNCKISLSGLDGSGCLLKICFMAVRPNEVSILVYNESMSIVKRRM